MSAAQGGHDRWGAALEASPEGVLIRLKVVPGASRSKVAGMLGDRLKVAVAAPPEGGKANAAVCDLLARTLGVAKRDVQVTAGPTQPLKTVAVRGITAAAAAARLDAS